jgi:hypothetical protein
MLRSDFQERPHAVAAEVGVHRQRVGVEGAIRVQEGLGVRLGRRADVAAFGVDNHQQPLRARVPHRLDQGPEAVCAVQLVEGGLRLHGHSHIGRGVDNLLVEGSDRVRRRQAVEAVRQLVEAGIQAHAHGAALAPAGFF